MIPDEAYWERLAERRALKEERAAPREEASELGRWIRKARLEQGLSVRKLSEMSYVGETSIYRMENGRQQRLSATSERHLRAVLTSATPIPTQDTLSQLAWRVARAAALSGAVPVNHLFMPTRRHPVVRARRAAWYVLRHRYNWGLARIGQAFGVDHSTVHAGLKKVREAPEYDPELWDLTKKTNQLISSEAPL